MDNTNVWLIGDTHFGLKGDDSEWLDDYIGYFENHLIPTMMESAGKNDILIHCGDVFDNRSNVGLETLTRVISLFEKFSEIFGDIRIIVGNHDMMRKSSTEITALNALKHIKNVKVYFEPSVEEICGKSCLFNPWIEDLDEERKLLDSVDVDYIFGHLMIGGSRNSDRSGGNVILQNGVKMSDFKSAQVYAGHIHIRQDNKNVHYVGNPYHKDRGDIGNTKGITVLDISTGESKFIENTYSPIYVRDNIYDILNLTIGDVKNRWKNNRVELHVNGKDMPKLNVDEFTRSLDKCYKSFSVIGDSTPTELNISTDVGFGDAMSSDEYVSEFLNNQDLESGFRKMVDDKLEEFRYRI